MGLLALMLTLGVYLQGKGFLYHWYPPIVIAVALLALSGAELLLRWWPDRWFLRPEILLAVIVPLACVNSHLYWSSEQGREADLEKLVRTHAQGDAIGVLSTFVNGVFPMVNETGVGWASRYSSLWQIPGFYGEGWTPGCYRTIEVMPEEERAFVESVAADLERSRPALLLVDQLPPTPAMKGFDYLAYFAKSPRFARLLDDYLPLVKVGTYRAFQRKDTVRTTDSGWRLFIAR
jgi:hypothetical protein